MANTTSAGYVVNLMSNDAQRLEDFAVVGHFLWAGPFTLIIVTFFIYLEIGWACLGSAMGILLIVPLQILFSAKFKTLRKETLKFKDSKSKTLSDTLFGITVVKFYGWEPVFLSRILDIRAFELKWIWLSNLLKSINLSMYYSSQIFINAITFTTFYLMGGELTPSKVFSVFMYIEIIRSPMTIHFSHAIQYFSECHVSLERIEAFLHMPSTSKIKDSKIIQMNNVDQSVIIKINSATFSWIKDQPTLKTDLTPLLSQSSLPVISKNLENISLSIKKGDLVGLIGSVGSGKTMLLYALLGDLEKTKGEMYIGCDKISYSSQVPWIVAGSIKSNILFGQLFDQNRFQKVLEVSMLEKDLEGFSDGVDTLVGEKGVTLSGGQRARLSLARALYYDAELYLLDDPLSALDPSTAQNVFKRAIKGYLRSKVVKN
jgi:ATP-binding cassette subfamily C (CFTR/MRP) protein 4